MLCLSDADRRVALQLARKAIREAVLHRELPNVVPSEGVFSERHGVFVTLHVQGRLQGCIGVTEPSEPLGEAIEHRLTREQFLEETCRKAGLPREAWKEAETRIFGFTCEVFSDDSPAEKV